MQKLVTAFLPLTIVLAGGSAWLVKAWQYGGYLTVNTLALYGIGLIAAIGWAVFRLRRKTPHA